MKLYDFFLITKRKQEEKKKGYMNTMNLKNNYVQKVFFLGVY